MAAPTITLSPTTISATTDSTTITIADADFFLIKAIQDLTQAINRLASRMVTRG